MASKPVNILADCLLPSRPLIDSDMSWQRSSRPNGGRLECQACELEYEADYKGRLLLDYANKNSCLIYGPDTPIAVPYNLSATHDVLGIVIAKDLVTHFI